MSASLIVLRVGAAISQDELQSALKEVEEEFNDIEFSQNGESGNDFDCKYWGVTKCYVTLTEKGEVQVESNSALYPFVYFTSSQLNEKLEGIVFDPQYMRDVQDTDEKKYTFEELKNLVDQSN